MSTSLALGSTEFWERVEHAPAALAYELCAIDLTNLENTLQYHAAIRGWVTATHETFRIEEERAKWDLTRARASALLAAKAVADPQTGKAKTVAVLDAEVENESTVVAAQEQLLRVQHRRGVLKAVADSLVDRKDMLVQLSANTRREQDD